MSVQRGEIGGRAEVLDRQEPRGLVGPKQARHPVTHRRAAGDCLVKAALDQRAVFRRLELRVFLHPRARLLEDEAARRGPHAHGAVHVPLARALRQMEFLARREAAVRVQVGFQFIRFVTVEKIRPGADGMKIGGGHGEA